MSELKLQPMFFLGANSPKGFVSSFATAFSQTEGWRTYIIKGGPGTGKSTLMKRVADYFLKRGLRCQLCPCSSDPASLDAVIFPDAKIVLLDGTAPHVVEPLYPGACEEIVNLGECWDAAQLYDKRDEIIKLTKENKECHRKASSYLAAAGAVISDTAQVAALALRRDKAQQFAKKLAKKHIPKTAAVGKEWVRYLGGVTPKGLVFYGRTIDKMCENKIVISDEFGAAAPVIMAEIRASALAYGHEIITCYCPMDPKNKLEHIIIPALKLAFCTSNRLHPIQSTERVIHARRFMDMAEFHKQRARVNFNRKAVMEFLNMAADSLDEAKTVHDRLERQYIKAMDFDKLNDITKKLIMDVHSII